MKAEKTIIREGWAYGLLIALIGLMALVGCSKDDAAAAGSNGEPAGTSFVEVASYVRWFDETNGANRANRAWAIPTGYIAYEDGEQSIGIAFTQNGVDPAAGADPGNPKSMIGNFFKSGDKWRTNVEGIAASQTYYLYGYIPHQTAIDYSITDLNVANDAYNAGAIMTLEKVPTVMSKDLCVVIGAKQGTDKEHDSGLRMGDFGFTSSASATGNYVFLLFDHLYAALRIKMKVYKDYNNLRTIKLKSLQLGTQADEGTTRQKTDITIRLESTDGSVSPIKSITFNQPETYPVIDGEGLEFWSDDAGEELTTTDKQFIGHFMPSGITTLVLTSVYDVYDKKGNLIRKGCKATNTMVLKELLTGQTYTERGKRYTINMTIQPTYLYMLSEPDLDNPTVTIN